jgi:hypothetical protein
LCSLLPPLTEKISHMTYIFSHAQKFQPCDTHKGVDHSAAATSL